MGAAQAPPGRGGPRGQPLGRGGPRGQPPSRGGPGASQNRRPTGQARRPTSRPEPARPKGEAETLAAPCCLAAAVRAVAQPPSRSGRVLVAPGEGTRAGSPHDAGVDGGAVAPVGRPRPRRNAGAHRGPRCHGQGPPCDRGRSRLRGRAPPRSPRLVGATEVRAGEPSHRHRGARPPLPGSRPVVLPPGRRAPRGAAPSPPLRRSASSAHARAMRPSKALVRAMAAVAVAAPEGRVALAAAPWAQWPSS